VQDAYSKELTILQEGTELNSLQHLQYRNREVTLLVEKYAVKSKIRDYLLPTSIFGASEGLYITANIRRMLKVLFKTSSYKTEIKLLQHLYIIMHK
jgi:hypothetical protein